MIFLLTALAGGFGGAARFTVDTIFSRQILLSVPMGTIVVNTTACLLLGLLTGAVSAHPNWGDLQQIFGVGLLGGYSTFSTASVEGARLVRQGRYVAGAVHAGGMLVVCLLASMLGLVLGTVVS